MKMDQKSSSDFVTKDYLPVSYKHFLDLLEVACRMNQSVCDLMKGNNDVRSFKIHAPLYYLNHINDMDSFLDFSPKKVNGNFLYSKKQSYADSNFSHEESEIINNTSEMNEKSNEDHYVHNGFDKNIKINKSSKLSNKVLHVRKPLNIILSLEDELLQKSKIFTGLMFRNSKMQFSLKDADGKNIHRNNTNKMMVDINNGKSNMDNSQEIKLEYSMKCKLSDVIQEGLLDSVLPYIIPKDIPLSDRRGVTSADVKNIVSHGKSLSTSSLSIYGSSTIQSDERIQPLDDLEVEIHVCDEVKNLRKDFKCSQKLLVSKMGYFAEVTTGQRLEDMDISVHCDITIFDWLMRWVQKDFIPKDDWPKLDPGNVVPILISAAFLQMDPLLDNCLIYCHKNANEILNRTSNLACLNDNILSRFANMFSNSEVESLKDNKDKIQSRLYCRFIEALSSSVPREEQGHFSTLSCVYKCSNCNQLVSKQLCAQISCVPSHTKLDFFGNICANHTRDSEWDVNQYITTLFDDLKSWRKVYWYLWGNCHFLFCCNCKAYFSVHRFLYCYDHKDVPQFFTMEHQRTIMSPTGRFSCCGQKAYRFEVIRNQFGCQLREHSPFLESVSDWELYTLLMKYRDLVILKPPDPITLNMSKEIPRLLNFDLLWNGLELATRECKTGLFPKIWEIYLKEEEQHILNEFMTSSTQPVRHVVPCVFQKHYFMNLEKSNFITVSTDEDSSDSDSIFSEESQSSSVKCTNKSRQSVRIRKELRSIHQNEFKKLHWDSKLSTRSNQDNQREYEQSTLKCMTGLLTRRTSAESSNIYDRAQGQLTNCSCHHSNPLWNTRVPPGGIYVRLEQQWKERNSSLHTNIIRQRCMNGKGNFKSRNCCPK